MELLQQHIHINPSQRLVDLNLVKMAGSTPGIRLCQENILDIARNSMQPTGWKCEWGTATGSTSATDCKVVLVSWNAYLKVIISTFFEEASTQWITYPRPLWELFFYSEFFLMTHVTLPLGFSIGKKKVWCPASLLLPKAQSDCYALDYCLFSVPSAFKLYTSLQQSLTFSI